MKKILAFVLAAVLLLGMTACGTVNETEVSVLWSGEGVARVPDSLINAMERAMYIENISYVHYGANGDQAQQTATAQEVLDKNCSGLIVELVDVTAAQTIVDMAKAKNVPVVFMNSSVDATIVSSYDKCVSVFSDEGTIATVLGESIAKTISKEKDYEKADLNGDGKITYLALGEVSDIVDAVNSILQEAERNAIEAVKADSIAELTVTTETVKKTEYGRLTDSEGNVVEMIISDNDVAMLNDLVALQEKEFNANKLKTHFVPVYTVGADADYKTYVFDKIPAIGTALNNGELDKQAAISEDVMEQIREYSNLINLASPEKWEDLEIAVYTTRNVIADGRLSNAATVDLDSLAGAVAKAMKDLLQGVALENNNIAVAYTAIN